MDSARYGLLLGCNERNVVAEQGRFAMAFVGDNLSVAEMEHRFVNCADPVHGRHMQVIWLLAQGHFSRGDVEGEARHNVSYINGGKS